MGVRFEQVSLSAWDITSAYQIGTKVKYGDYMYVAKKDVPKGINIGMTDYWDKITKDVSIDDITEIDIDEVANGDILRYNSTSHKWENTELPSFDVSYSNTERKIGKWFNDDLYKITLEVTLTTGQNEIDLSESVTDIDDVINIEMVTLDDGVSFYGNGMYFNQYATLGMRYTKSTTTLRIQCGSSAPVGTAYVTLYYTKGE